MSRRHAMNCGTAVTTAVRTSHAVTRGGTNTTALKPTHGGSVIDVALAAAPINVTRSRREFGCWLNTLGVYQLQIDEILLAVCEAVTNAIEHGSGCDPSKEVGIRAAVCDQVVHVTICDSGQWISGCDRPASYSHRGKGLILMKELADHVDIACTADGTEITMQFRISEFNPQ